MCVRQLEDSVSHHCLFHSNSDWTSCNDLVRVSIQSYFDSICNQDLDFRYLKGKDPILIELPLFHRLNKRL